jgi:cell division protein FtsZ
MPEGELMALITDNDVAMELDTQSNFEQAAARSTNMVTEQLAVADVEIKDAKLKVVGVGGGGSNAVSRMYRERLEQVDYITVNTDQQALVRSDVPTRLRIGDTIAAGLGVGGDPDKGQACADESRDELRDVLSGADMVFIACGMGGGTGTGAAPIVAEVAQEMGALTVGVVTRPFSFEGKRRRHVADEGIARLRDQVDSFIVIPNDRLMIALDQEVTMESAFRMADNVLRRSVQSIAELITVAGEINVDFADVKAIMSNAGPTWMSIGYGTGEDRAIIAAEDAINSNLLDVSISGARGVIFNITSGGDATISEVQTASEVIQRVVDPEANIIFGMATDPKMENEIKLTVVATGFTSAEETAQAQEEMAEQLGSMTNEEMDVPPFLRHHPQARRALRNPVHSN